MNPRKIPVFLVVLLWTLPSLGSFVTPIREHWETVNVRQAQARGFPPLGFRAEVSGTTMYFTRFPAPGVLWWGYNIGDGLAAFVGSYQVVPGVDPLAAFVARHFGHHSRFVTRELSTATVAQAPRRTLSFSSRIPVRPFDRRYEGSSPMHWCAVELASPTQPNSHGLVLVLGAKQVLFDSRTPSCSTVLQHSNIRDIARSIRLLP